MFLSGQLLIIAELVYCLGLLFAAWGAGTPQAHARLNRARPVVVRNFPHWEISFRLNTQSLRVIGGFVFIWVVRYFVDKDKLTPKQERFCEEYLVDLNATQAAIRAGYSANGINKRVTRMMANDGIKSRIEELRNAQSERTEITADRVLQELAAIAFADRTKIAAIQESGEVAFTPTDKLSDDVKKTISGIEHGKYGIKVSTCDKIKALELLGKHIGLFADNVKLTGEMGVTIVDDIE